MPVDGGRTVDLAVRLEPAPIAHDRRRARLRHRRGRARRGELAAPQFLQSRRRADLRGVAGTQEQLAAVQFRRNNFLRRDQVLNLQASASDTRSSTPTRRKTVLLAGNIERQSNFIWQKKWTWSLGAELLATDERGMFEATGRQGHADLLHRRAAGRASAMTAATTCSIRPRGFRLGGRVSPEISRAGRQLRLCAAPRSTRAPIIRCRTASSPPGRVRLGTIVGAGVFDIAPSRRFYSGGGGSVRGYGYQQLGPKDVDGDPIGGRGLAEFALEARIRLKAVRRQFRDRAVLRRRHADDRGAARLQGLAVRRRHRRALLFELRSDPDRRRHAAQPRRRATGRSRSPSRSARPSDGRDAVADATGEPPRAPAAARLAAAAAQRAARAVRRAAVPARRRCWCCSTRAPGHRFIVDRIGRLETASGLRIRIGRIDGSIFGKSQLQERRGRRPARRVPDLARRSSSTGRPAPGSTTSCTSTA